MKLRCLIIDDEPDGRKVLEEHIGEVGFLELIGKVENPVKAMPVLSTGEVDLIFLDIQMPQMNGIEFLKDYDHKAAVILTTAYSEYALQGYELDVIDYLMKPVSVDRFLKASTKALDYIARKKWNRSEQNYFFIKSNGKFEKIECDELLYVEAANNYVILQTTRKRFITYCTLRSMEDILGTMDFIKVHKSFLVALSKIDSLDSEEIMIGPYAIPISRNWKDFVWQKVLNRKLVKR